MRAYSFTSQTSIGVGRTLSSNIRILKSFEDVEPYIDHARTGADTERDAFGFLPPNAYRQAAEQGKLFVAVDADGIFLGHLMFGGRFPHSKVIQIYTAPEFRKHGVAQTLMQELVDYAHDRAFLSLSAKVASDLEGANAFYERMGFQTVKTLRGGKTRDRFLYHRVRDLDTPSLFDLMVPKGQGHLPSLGISSKYSSKTPIYAIDLNVLFDVSKQRARSEEAGLVIRAATSGDIRLVIAEEFIKELQRSSHKFTNDPLLKFALKLKTLPAPKSQDIKDIEEELAPVIFPERLQKGILKTQDKSDLKHLATSIRHKITGFITSENAILRAHDYLRSEFGLEVLGVSDFADAMTTNDDIISPYMSTWTQDIELSSAPLTGSTSNNVRSFLKTQHVPPQITENALSQGDFISPQRHLTLRGKTSILSFAAWTLTHTPHKIAQVFLCADEDSPAANTAIDHTLDRICREVSSGASALIHLQILPGHPVTRKIALTHGFRPEPGNEEHGTTLHKVAIGAVIDELSWRNIRKSLTSLSNAELPPTIPEYEGPDQRISIKTSSGRVEEIPLQELETLLSPALILLPSRPGAIVPIRRVFADELLGTAEQFSLLALQEAVLLKERVYYSTPRAASILAPGTAILFYESSKGGGRKSIVAVGRATESHVLTEDQVNPDTKRKGVLGAGDFKHIGVSETKLVTAFDNIMAFNNPVPLDKLREIGCVDGANFRTAKRIKPHLLTRIIHEGLKNG